MTPAQFKHCRHALGLTQAELARLLRLKGSGKRTIRSYESGDIPVSGPVSVVLEMLCSGHDPMKQFHDERMYRIDEDLRYETIVGSER